MHGINRYRDFEFICDNCVYLIVYGHMKNSYCWSECRLNLANSASFAKWLQNVEFSHTTYDAARTTSSSLFSSIFFYQSATFLPHAVNCGRFCFSRRQSVPMNSSGPSHPKSPILLPFWSSFTSPERLKPDSSNLYICRSYQVTCVSLGIKNHPEIGVVRVTFSIF